MAASLTLHQLQQIFAPQKIQGFMQGSETRLDQSIISVLTITFEGQKEDTQYLVKHVDVQEQKARIKKTEEKWCISVMSFQNEYNFYDLQDLLGMIAAGVNVPLCYYKAITRDASTGQLETSTLLLEYLPPDVYTQYQDLTFDQAKAALATLAKFHVFHWQQQQSSNRSGLLERGAWWRAELRPSVKFDTIAETFVSLCTNFVPEFEELNTPENHALMKELQAHVKEIGVRVRAKGDKTLVHGDCKASNLFFHRRTGECSLIDMQWAGWASSGGADVAYLLWSAIDVQASARETELLDFYYETFTSAAAASAAATPIHYTKEEFLQDYEIEVLDLAKTILPQLLNGIDREYCKANFGRSGWLSHEYLPQIMANFVAKVLSILQRTQW
jgi:hypothetical protein